MIFSNNHISVSSCVDFYGGLFITVRSFLVFILQTFTIRVFTHDYQMTHDISASVHLSND